MANQVQQARQLFSFLRQRIFHLWRDLVVICPGDQSIFFKELEAVGKDGVADVFQIVLNELEAIVTFLDTKQYIGKPSFADNVQQFIERAFFFKIGLVAIVGRSYFSL